MPGVFQRTRTPQEADASAILPIVLNRHVAHPLLVHDGFNPRTPVVEPVIDDLVVAYAFELADIYQTVTQLDLTRLGLTLETLHGVAVRNLDQRAVTMPRDWAGPMMEITIGSQLGAAVLLLTDSWQRLAQTAPGEVPVALPNPNVLLISSTEMPRGGVAALQFEIERRQPGTSRDGVSRNLLVWRNGLWEVFGPAEQVQITI